LLCGIMLSGNISTDGQLYHDQVFQARPWQGLVRTASDKRTLLPGIGRPAMISIPQGMFCSPFGR
jgi:hypothetical protein